jgi:hypothetical protein
MLAEFQGLKRVIEPIDVGDEPPREMVVQPDVRVGWGGLRDEDCVFRLDRIELQPGGVSRAVYVLA